MNQLIIDYIEQEDALFASEIAENLYIHEYVVIGYSVFNTGVVFDAPYFTNDLESHDSMLDSSQIFRVGELYDSL